MTITTGAREGLSAIIVPHEGQSMAVKTSTGLLKTRKGLIITPTSFTGKSLHSGAVDELTEEEKAILQVEDEKQEPQQQQYVEEHVKSRRKRRTAVTSTVEVTKDVVVDIGIGGAGTIRSQCRHCHVGSKGIVVMGLGPLSYRPNEAAWDDNGQLKNTMTLSVAGGLWVFTGEEFTDSQGIINIILHKVPEEPVEEECTGDEEEE